MRAECGPESEAWLCSLPPPPSQVIHVHLGPPGMDGWKEAEQGLPAHHPLPAPTCTYLQAAVLKVLEGVPLLLQD